MQRVAKEKRGRPIQGGAVARGQDSRRLVAQQRTRKIDWFGSGRPVPIGRLRGTHSAVPHCWEKRELYVKDIFLTCVFYLFFSFFKKDSSLTKASTWQISSIIRFSFLSFLFPVSGCIGDPIPRLLNHCLLGRCVPELTSVGSLPGTTSWSVRSYELRLVWALGPVPSSLKDAAKQGLNWNQMRHCPPRSSDIICVRF